MEIESTTWPLEKLGTALEALARAGALPLSARGAPDTPAHLLVGPAEGLDTWAEDSASLLGLEAEPLQIRHVDVPAVLDGAGPALIRVNNGAGGDRLLALLRARRRAVEVVGPDQTVRTISSQCVRDWICRPAEVGIDAQLDTLLADTRLRDPTRTRAAMLSARLAAVPVANGWMLRLAPGSAFRHQARTMRLSRRTLLVLACHAGAYLLLAFSWWLVGRGAIAGRMDRAWMSAWALALATAAALRLLAAHTGGLLVVDGGALMKQRMMEGALRLSPEEVRHRGTGDLVGRVIESEAIESLPLGGGLLAALAAVELLVALPVLAAGTAGALHVTALIVWIVATLGLGALYLGTLRAWTGTRVEMTHTLVERMSGHATRLAQEAPERWHEGEDDALAEYVEQSRRLDGAAARLAVLVPRSWLLAAVLGLGPAFARGGSSPARVAISLGGILLAYGGLRRLVAGLPQIASAIVAWAQARPLLGAAARSNDGQRSAATLVLGSGAGAPLDDGQILLDARDLVFQHRPHGEAVLRGATLRVRVGDRILLEGASGAGKSTMGAVLAGLRVPTSGLLTLRGLDQQTIGPERWRRRVAAAPQFHENYVLTGSFAFNLLMGRRWPPTAQDMAEADTVCRELGLGPLLSRMPAGILQMVGETGWQLSHGERSRLYIARALLQGAEMLVLDESFAALDPETLRQAMQCVLARAKTMVVIAHP